MHRVQDIRSIDGLEPIALQIPFILVIRSLNYANQCPDVLPVFADFLLVPDISRRLRDTDLDPHHLIDLA